jgi:glycerophosphoryl diester phosphodiesterase
MDVRRCGDETVVVIHDATLDRTTSGRGRVRDFPIHELQRFDAGAGDCIPRLSDVLDVFGSKCPLNIELKETGLSSDVARMVLERGLAQNVLISAFDCDDPANKAESTWQELADLSPRMPVALICSKAKLSEIGADALVAHAVRIGAVAVHPQIGANLPGLLSKAHLAGLRVNVWTLNDPADIARARVLGVDGIFTDVPELAARS